MDGFIRSPRRLGRLAGLVGIVAGLALASVPAAGTTGIGNGLFAFVRLTNAGPLPPCPDPDGIGCTSENQTNWFVYVANTNRPTQELGRMRTRATLPRSFVVDDVEVRLTIDGTEFGTPFVLTPPPNAFFQAWSGHWPATVTCPPSGIPCNSVAKPAIVPGEVTAAVYGGWVHTAAEAKGTHVFHFAVRGTIDGAPVVLRARSQPIEMT